MKDEIVLMLKTELEDNGFIVNIDDNIITIKKDSHKYITNLDKQLNLIKKKVIKKNYLAKFLIHKYNISLVYKDMLKSKS